MKTNRLKALCSEAISLNGRMHDELIVFLNRHNNFIRTDNHGKNSILDCYIFNEALEEIKELPVIAVTIINNNVAILPDYNQNYEEEEYKEMSDQELLELDGWQTIFGGLILCNATLYSLCSQIEDYVEQ